MLGEAVRCRLCTPIGVGRTGIENCDEKTRERIWVSAEANWASRILIIWSYYELNGTKALREFSGGASIDRPCLLKHSVDTVEQFTQVVQTAVQRRTILDPAVMEGLIVRDDL